MMSSKIQDKLLKLEIAPPEKVWDQIAMELDDAGNGMQFPNTLRELSVSVPAHCWEEINYQLDETALHGKVAEKLYAAEVYPPVTAWQAIGKSLDHAKEAAPAITRQRSPFWKYAAAALLIGFMGYAAWQLFPSGKQQEDDPTARSLIHEMEATSHTQAGIDAALLHEETPPADNTSEERNDAALEASKQSFARLDLNPTQKASLAAFSYQDYMNPDELTEHGHLGFAEAIAPVNSKDDRYIVLMTPDGHFIRMSKKLSNLVCCVAGEEADKNCETQLEKWRKQIACSDASHPGNFMDILSLVNALQEQ